MTMRTRTKFSIAVGALGAVALVAAVVPGTVASGTNPPTIPGGGVLRLHLSKRPELQPKKIQVKSNA